MKCMRCEEPILSGAKTPHRLCRKCRKSIPSGARYCTHPNHGSGPPWGEGDRLKDLAAFYRRQYSYCRKCQVAQSCENNKRARALKAAACATTT